MPSPRNSCPAPSRSFATSLLNERSAMRLYLCVLLCADPQLTQIHATAIIFKRIYQRKSPTGSLFLPEERKHALDVHRRRGGHSGGIVRRGPGGHAPRRVVLRRGHRVLEELRALHRKGE